jgi:hypothetical protein
VSQKAFDTTHDSGQNTTEKVPTNSLIGFNGTYTENTGTIRVPSCANNNTVLNLGMAGADSITTNGQTLTQGKGLLVGDYDFASTRYGLSEQTTALLNANTIAGSNGQVENGGATTTLTERFVDNGRASEAAVHTDMGVFSTVKLRVKQPTLTVE